MLEIAEFIPPKPQPLWKLAKQAGVDLAVAGLPFDTLQAGEKVSSLSALQRMKDVYTEGGFDIRVIESRPPLNLVISNVPGPRTSLYCAGAEMLSNFPVSVIVDGVGLNITVVSYKDRVDFGIVGDREQIDDAWAFLEGAAHALTELEDIGKGRP